MSGQADRPQYDWDRTPPTMASEPACTHLRHLDRNGLVQAEARIQGAAEYAARERWDHVTGGEVGYSRILNKAATLPHLLACLGERADTFTLRWAQGQGPNNSISLTAAKTAMLQTMEKQILALRAHHQRHLRRFLGDAGWNSIERELLDSARLAWDCQASREDTRFIMGSSLAEGLVSMLRKGVGGEPWPSAHVVAACDDLEELDLMALPPWDECGVFWTPLTYGPHLVLSELSRCCSERHQEADRAQMFANSLSASLLSELHPSLHST